MEQDFARFDPDVVNADPSTLTEWADEVRDYLLGRLSRKRSIGALPQVARTRLESAPIRDWWMFEGKRYALLPGGLQDDWDYVSRLCCATLRTFNPAWRMSDRPDGWVDWGRTLSRGPHGVGREFVVQSSRVGLGDDERGALLGWTSWIRERWRSYCEDNGEPAREPLPDVVEQPGVRPAHLQRWAYIAKRSRWPVLRELVAETLRLMLEPQDVERVPLPQDRPTLFELVCLVRILRWFSGAPPKLRWLDPRTNANALRLGPVTAHYQYDLGRTPVLGAYDDAAAEALRRFDVAIPRRADLVFELAERPLGFLGILVEVKSGGETSGSALEQLRVYRAALKSKGNGRWLVWGLVEQAPRLTSDQLQHVRTHCRNSNDDVWVFSSGDDIENVLDGALKRE